MRENIKQGDQEKEDKYNIINKKRRKWLSKTKDNSGNIDIKHGSRNITLASMNASSLKTNNAIRVIISHIHGKEIDIARIQETQRK